MKKGKFHQFIDPPATPSWSTPSQKPPTIMAQQTSALKDVFSPIAQKKRIFLIFKFEITNEK
jgi:hypothetical protein